MQSISSFPQTMTTQEKFNLGLRLLDTYARGEGCLNSLISEIFQDINVQAKFKEELERSSGEARVKFVAAKYNYYTYLMEHGQLPDRDREKLLFIRAVLLCSSYVPRWSQQQVKTLHSQSINLLGQYSQRVKFFVLGANICTLRVNATMIEIFNDGKMSLYTPSFEDESCSQYLTELGIQKTWHSIDRIKIEERFTKTFERISQLPHIKTTNIITQAVKSPSQNSTEKEPEREIKMSHNPEKEPEREIKMSYSSEKGHEREIKISNTTEVEQLAPQPVHEIKKTNHQKIILSLQNLAGGLLKSSSESDTLNRFLKKVNEAASLPLTCNECNEVQAIITNTISGLSGSSEKRKVAFQILERAALKNFITGEDYTSLALELLTAYSKQKRFSDQDILEMMTLIKKILTSSDQVSENQLSIILVAICSLTRNMDPEPYEKLLNLFQELEDILISNHEMRQFCNRAVCQILYPIDLGILKAEAVLIESLKKMTALMQWIISSQIGQDPTFWDSSTVKYLINLINGLHELSEDRSCLLSLLDLISDKRDIMQFEVKHAIATYLLSTDLSDLHLIAQKLVGEDAKLIASTTRIQQLIDQGTPESILEACERTIKTSAELTPETAITLVRAMSALPFDNELTCLGSIREFYDYIENQIFFSVKAINIDRGHIESLFDIYDQMIKKLLDRKEPNSVRLGIDLLKRSYMRFRLYEIRDFHTACSLHLVTICAEQKCGSQLHDLREYLESLEPGLSETTALNNTIRTFVLDKEHSTLISSDNFDQAALKSHVLLMEYYLPLYLTLDPEKGCHCVARIVEFYIKKENRNERHFGIQLLNSAIEKGLFPVSEVNSRTSLRSVLLTILHSDLIFMRLGCKALIDSLKHLLGATDLSSQDEMQDYIKALELTGNKLLQAISVSPEPSLLKMFKEKFFKELCVDGFYKKTTMKKATISIVTEILHTCMNLALVSRCTIKCLNVDKTFINLFYKEKKEQKQAKMLSSLAEKYNFLHMGELLKQNRVERDAKFVFYGRMLATVRPDSLSLTSKAFSKMGDIGLDLIEFLIFNVSDKRLEVLKKICSKYEVIYRDEYQSDEMASFVQFDGRCVKLNKILARRLQGQSDNSNAMDMSGGNSKKENEEKRDK